MPEGCRPRLLGGPRLSVLPRRSPPYEHEGPLPRKMKAQPGLRL
jgi:hypothetical protein